MGLYVDQVATIRMMLAGFDSAANRLDASVLRQDPGVVFAPLFEALNWATVLDDRIRESWAPKGKVLGWSWRNSVDDGAVVVGTRFARNRVHHQWADALRIDHAGAMLPAPLPFVFFEWKWIDTARIPLASRANDNLGLNEYRQLLEGHPARLTVGRLHDIFHSVIDVLEPETWANSSDLHTDRVRSRDTLPE